MTKRIVVEFEDDAEADEFITLLPTLVTGHVQAVYRKKPETNTIWIRED